jgi:hypothetical protein
MVGEGDGSKVTAVGFEVGVVEGGRVGKLEGSEEGNGVGR